MIWFLKPRKDKGISFLKIEKDNEDDFMTMWLPGFSDSEELNLNKKVTFMGSDLSFEDLTNRTIEDYNYNIIKPMKMDFTFESIQKKLKGIFKTYHKNQRS